MDPTGNYNDDFNEDEDLKNRIYKAGLELAGPGRNPELAVYSEFQHLMGIDIGDWVYISCIVIMVYFIWLFVHYSLIQC